MNLYHVIFYLLFMVFFYFFNIYFVNINKFFVFMKSAFNDAVFSKMYSFLFHFYTMKRKEVKIFCFNFLVSRYYYYYFFDILVFVSFLLTYYGIFFFHIPSFYFFLIQINFCIYPLLALLIFLYHFYNNLFLYLVSHLCCFFL